MVAARARGWREGRVAAAQLAWTTNDDLGVQQRAAGLLAEAGVAVFADTHHGQPGDHEHTSSNVSRPGVFKGSGKAGIITSFPVQPDLPP